MHLINHDERFQTAKKNIQSVETLIIDEVSIISSKVLQQVQYVCKNVRKSNKSFGGIQVILVSDFYQLSLVSNELYGNSGKHCFMLPWFNEFFPHKINLNIIHRQDEPNLIKCVNELEIGTPSDETVAFQNSLDRPLENEDDCVHLFAKKIDVDMIIYTKLQQIPGELKIYKSKDKGSEYYSNRFPVSKTLGLKIGFPVMITKNLNEHLVNGTRGTITNLNVKNVDVKLK